VLIAAYGEFQQSVGQLGSGRGAKHDMRSAAPKADVTPRGRERVSESITISFRAK